MTPAPDMAKEEQAACEIVARLQRHGHEAYWVGGCVRNRLLGLPADDFDIATSARPEAVAALFPRHRAVGAHFGILLVSVGDCDIEVATFRSDGAYHDHRHPDAVTYGSLRDDAVRRDFTINALYFDPLAERLIDLVGGRADLDARRLCCVGDPERRFAEDALRLLRAIRFAARFELAIEPATWEALRGHCHLIAAISPERVRDELVRMLTGPRRGAALRLLADAGLLAVILPEIDAMRGVEQPAAFHPEGDVFEHTCGVLDALAPACDQDAIEPALALAALLHDVGKSPTFRRAPDRIRFDRHATVGADLADAICLRLRLPNREREKVVALVSRHMTFMDIGRMKPSTLKRFLAADTIDGDLALHRADALASHGDASAADACLCARAQFMAEAAAILPPPLLRGDDLIAMGYAPGPFFREALTAVTDAQLDGEIASREEAIAWFRRRYPPPPAEPS